MSELKKCSSCGSEKLKIDKKSKLYAHAAVGRIERHTFSVRCNVCHARGGAVSGMVADCFCGEIGKIQITTDNELKAAAIAAWNTRKPVEGALERLKKEQTALFSARNKLSLEMYSNQEAHEKARVLLEKELTLCKAIEIIKEELGGAE